MRSVVAKDQRSIRWPVLFALFSLTYLVAIVFSPIVGFEFADYDVDEQVVGNPYIRGLTSENLKHIFTSPCISSYYPFRTLTYAVDYSVWGLNPRGFKLTNGLLHLCNVVLVFWLILRLYSETPWSEQKLRLWDIFSAAFAASIFAIHPVVVEPVAWVPGREELLMTLGALACFHFHLSARRLSEDAGRIAAFAWHGAAAVSCTLACLSNAVAAVIPFLITAWDLLTLAKPKWRRLILGTGALWAIGAATITVKVLSADPESAVLESGISVAERLTFVLSLYWLNIKSLAWPSGLAISYSRSAPSSFFNRDVILGAIALGATCLVLWRLRRQRLLLFGLLWFGLALGPSSQIMRHHIHRADRFLYLPLVGLVIFMAVAFRMSVPMLKNRTAAIVAVGAAVLVVMAFDVRSTRQVQTWRDSIAIWENCVEVCPDNSLAQDLLARNLAKIGDFERAEEHALRSLELDFVDNHAALCSRVLKLIASDALGQPGREEALRLARRACDLTEWHDPKCLQTLATAQLASDQREAAVATGEKAAERAGDTELAKEIRNWLRDVRQP